MSGRSGAAFRELLVTIPVVLIIASYVLLPGIKVASASAEIELNPQQAPPGTNVKIKGSDFTALSPIMITFDGGGMDSRPAIIITNSQGKFEATFQVPFSIEDGNYTVVAKDISVFHNSASANFVVTTSNEPPTADPQQITVNQNEQIVVDLEGSDPDGDEITFSIKDQPQHGTISQFDSTSGTLTYTPEKDFAGLDSFTFTANDGKKDSAVAKVSMTVVELNHGPRMENQNVEIAEDSPIDIILSASDDDSASLSFVILAEPDHGSLGKIEQIDDKSARVTYTPFADYNGAESFTVRATDDKSESEIATVSISIISVNDPPVAQAIHISTSQGKSVAVKLLGIDADGDPLTYILASNPAHGSLSGTSPDITYFPVSDYQGTDSFTYRVNDGTADSNDAQVDITIEAAPNNSNSGSSSGSGSDAGEPSQNPPETPPVSSQSQPAPVPETPPSTPSVPNSNSGQAPNQAPAESTDTIAPRLIFPSSTLVFDSQSKAGMSVSYNIGAIDDRDGEITPTCYPESGSRFPIGKVNVVCTATDSSGNKALGSFVLEVRLSREFEQKPGLPVFGLGDSQIAVIASVVVGSAGIAILAAARKTRAKSPQSQKST